MCHGKDHSRALISLLRCRPLGKEAHLVILYPQLPLEISSQQRNTTVSEATASREGRPRVMSRVAILARRLLFVKLWCVCVIFPYLRTVRVDAMFCQTWAAVGTLLGHPALNDSHTFGKSTFHPLRMVSVIHLRARGKGVFLCHSDATVLREETERDDVKATEVELTYAWRGWQGISWAHRRYRSGVIIKCMETS